MTTTDTPELAECPAFLVFEVRAASGVRILSRLEATCHRGRHPAGTIHHGTVQETGELVKWRAEPLPTTDPQLAAPTPEITDARIVEASFMTEGGPEDGVHPIESVTPVKPPAKRPGRPRKTTT